MLKDPTCNSYSPGTVAKWLCLNIKQYNWNYIQCWQEGQRRGIKSQDIYTGLKQIVQEQDIVDRAYREMMMTGVVSLPEWFYASCWYDYLNTCATLNKDFSSESTMRWWVNTYLEEPKFRIKASYGVQQDFINKFRGFLHNAPRRPMVERLADLFRTYRTSDFMV